LQQKIVIFKWILKWMKIDKFKRCSITNKKKNYCI
jgi:hypothetical protein